MLRKEKNHRAAFLKGKLHPIPILDLRDFTRFIHWNQFFSIHLTNLSLTNGTVILPADGFELFTALRELVLIDMIFVFENELVPHRPPPLKLSLPTQSLERFVFIDGSFKNLFPSILFDQFCYHRLTELTIWIPVMYSEEMTTDIYSVQGVIDVNIHVDAFQPVFPVLKRCLVQGCRVFFWDITDHHKINPVDWSKIAPNLDFFSLRTTRWPEKSLFPTSMTSLKYFACHMLPGLSSLTFPLSVGSNKQSLPRIFHRVFYDYNSWIYGGEYFPRKSLKIMTSIKSTAKSLSSLFSSQSERDKLLIEN